MSMCWGAERGDLDAHLARAHARGVSQRYSEFSRTPNLPADLLSVIREQYAARPRDNPSRP